MRRVPRATSSDPSARMPVPASRTTAISSPSLTSTQEVLPPYVTVSGPGVAIEPRQPQIFSPTDKLASPEDRDDADELVGVREEGKRSDLDLALDPVRARDQILPVGRPTLVQRNPRRAKLWGKRLRSERPRLERGEPVVERHLTCLGERPTDNGFGRLVVEDEVPARVCDQRRRRQVRRELTREDQDELLLALRVHRPPGDLTRPPTTRQEGSRRSGALAGTRAHKNLNAAQRGSP